ncbi:MAG TPA: hypothetical protein VKM56_04310 [Verrucomicrobiae bacterium]|nr:hypothetical protein [Verrucomicrobiae bacterium]
MRSTRRGFFAQKIRVRRWWRGPKGECAFTQGIEHSQFFFDGAAREALAERALALQDFGQVEGHGVRNCFSNRCHAAFNPCRVMMS